MGNVTDNDMEENQVWTGEDTSGRRIGQRIREIRTARGLSQQQLGEKIGLNGPRIQNYESGARKPKADLLFDIAGALNVSGFALMDPVIPGYIGAMYALFELDKQFGISIECPSADEESQEVVIRFGDGITGELNESLRAWAGEKAKAEALISYAETEAEKKIQKQKYKDWMWAFPRPIEVQIKQSKINQKRAEIQKEIDNLQKQLCAISDTVD